MVTDGAWYRVRDEKLAELRAAIAAGTLVSRGKGKRAKVESGAFFDWRGEPVPVVPDFGMRFEVRPDADAAEVRRGRRHHEFIRKLLDRAACMMERPLHVDGPLLQEPSGRFDADFARLVVFTLRSLMTEDWRELCAIERRLDAVSEELDGEDVLHPSLRERFDEAKAGLLKLREQLLKYVGEFELPEDHDHEVDGLVTTIFERATAD